MDYFTLDFAIVGAQKCGTTTLTKILRTHPSIVCCNQKEPHFFSKSNDWESRLSEYERQFRRKTGAIYFEASTTYTFYPHFNLSVWEDMHAYNPAMKIIYIVRDPVQRIISGYMHSYERGYLDVTLEEAVIEKSRAMDITRYAMQITPFINQFGPEQVRILFFEDLVQEPRQMLDEVASFLEIPRSGFEDPASVHANRSISGDAKQHHKYDQLNIVQRFVKKVMPSVWARITDNSQRAFKRKPTLSSQYDRMIRRVLALEIDRLEHITGRDLSHWRDT